VDSAVRAGSGLDIFKRTPPVFGEHVAEHDPARVLRGIDAERKLLALYVKYECIDWETFEAESEHAPSLVSLRAAYRDAVRHHAAVYADRPGYKEEWRP
jgi:hypothetical protein